MRFYEQSNVGQEKLVTCNNSVATLVIYGIKLPPWNESFSYFYFAMTSYENIRVAQPLWGS